MPSSPWITARLGCRPTAGKRQISSSATCCSAPRTGVMQLKPLVADFLAAKVVAIGGEGSVMEDRLVAAKAYGEVASIDHNVYREELLQIIQEVLMRDKRLLATPVRCSGLDTHHG